MNAVAATATEMLRDQPTRKTPTDFALAADSYHNDLTQAAQKAAEAQAALDALSERRIALIGDARGYGCTPAYARAVLRKP